MKSKGIVMRLRHDWSFYVIFDKRWRSSFISLIISGGTSSLICSRKYFSTLRASDSQKSLEIWNSWRQSTDSFSPSVLIEPIRIDLKLITNEIKAILETKIVPVLGTNPMALVSAISSPAHRRIIQSRTRILSPNPGHKKCPFNPDR